MDKMKSSKIFKFIIFAICICFYIFFTVKGLAHHIPWRDEANAWNIAGRLNFIEIINIMKYQGHMFLWYAILKPFAAHNLFYPYSMQVINWLFVFSAVVLMWKYAKFNPLTKIFITFSFPFFKFYPIVAREYGIGILLLFILTILYKKKLNHPYIYTILIFFAANIGSITLAGVSAIGMIFLWDLFKFCKSNKKYKPIIFALTMCFLCIGTLFLQLGNFVIPHYAVEFNRYEKFLDFCFYYYKYEQLYIISLFVIPYTIGFLTFQLLKQHKKMFFFLYCSWVELFVIFYIYPCTDYHFYFLIIYLIMAYWIYLDEKPEKNNRNDNSLKIFFTVSMLILCFKTSQSGYCFTEPAMKIVNQLKQIDNIESYTIYSSSTYDTKVIVPYLPNIKYRSLNGEDLYTFEYFKECYYPETENYTLDQLYDKIDDKSLFLIRHNIWIVKELNTNKIKLIPIHQDENFYLAKIEKNI